MKETIQNLHKLFNEIAGEEILNHSSYEASIIQIPKPDISVTGKKTTDQYPSETQI